MPSKRNSKETKDMKEDESYSKSGGEKKLVLADGVAIEASGPKVEYGMDEEKSTISAPPLAPAAAIRPPQRSSSSRIVAMGQKVVRRFFPNQRTDTPSSPLPPPPPTRRHSSSSIPAHQLPAPSLVPPLSRRVTSSSSAVPGAYSIAPGRPNQHRTRLSNGNNITNGVNNNNNNNGGHDSFSTLTHDIDEESGVVTTNHQNSPAPPTGNQARMPSTSSGGSTTTNSISLGQALISATLVEEHTHDGDDNDPERNHDSQRNSNINNNSHDSSHFLADSSGFNTHGSGTILTAEVTDSSATTDNLCWLMKQSRKLQCCVVIVLMGFAIMIGLTSVFIRQNKQLAMRKDDNNNNSLEGHTGGGNVPTMSPIYPGYPSGPATHLTKPPGYQPTLDFGDRKTFSPALPHPTLPPDTAGLLHPSLLAQDALNTTSPTNSPTTTPPSPAPTMYPTTPRPSTAKPTRAPSPNPTELGRLGVLMNILTPVLSETSLSALDNTNSPQYQAVQWLTTDPYLGVEYFRQRRRMRTRDISRVLEQTSIPSYRIIQRYALATLFYATGGSTTWKRNDGWLSTNHECDWYLGPPTSGSSSTLIKYCDDSGRIINLDLSGNNLSSTVPNDISLLEYLGRFVKTRHGHSFRSFDMVNLSVLTSSYREN